MNGQPKTFSKVFKISAFEIAVKKLPQLKRSLNSTIVTKHMLGCPLSGGIRVIDIPSSFPSEGSESKESSLCSWICVDSGMMGTEMSLRGGIFVFGLLFYVPMAAW